MKLGYTILYVASVADTLAFYERAFGLARGMVADGNTYGELTTGDTTLAFAASAFVRGLHDGVFHEATPEGAAPPMEVGFVTDDVDAAFATAIAAGAAVVTRPERKPWGQWIGYVRDNNGFLVEIGSPMGG